VADLKGDFKVLFHDRHGDFYCWLNTAMIGTRQFLETKELDWFDRVSLNLYRWYQVIRQSQVRSICFRCRRSFYSAKWPNWTVARAYDP
jgi:hypothetical protein